MSYASLTHGLVPNFRLAGHGLGGAASGSRHFGTRHFAGINYPYTYPFAATYGYFYPYVADSYDPRYATPQTKYGSCICRGGRVTSNKCNFNQGGYYPQCLQGGFGCRCANFSGDHGCYNEVGDACV